MNCFESLNLILIRAIYNIKLNYTIKGLYLKKAVFVRVFIKVYQYETDNFFLIFQVALLKSHSMTIII